MNLLQAAQALESYRTATGSPREGFQDAARLLRMLADGRQVRPGDLEQR